MSYTTFSVQIPITTANLTNTVDYKILYRLTGTSTWTSFLTSGIVSSATIHGLTLNDMYDIQVQNINNFDNALSEIVNAIGFSDPTPVISPTNTTIGYGFALQSTYMTSYVVTIATMANPAIILQTQTQSPIPYITGTFSNLTPGTAYLMNIESVAGVITHTFSYAVTTATTTTCAAPTAVSAYLTTSGTTMNLVWTAPAPYPACSYNYFFRPKSASTYGSYTTSGMTSGTTTIPIILSAPACYEGYIQSNCCGTSQSLNVPFGVNTYQQLSFTVTEVGNPAYYYINLGLPYGNPYANVISFSFTDSIHGTVVINNLTIPAGTTTASINTGHTSYGGTISNIVIQSISPTFDNGGSIQQLDSLLTPQYFAFISTSGTTWSGSPIDLPSFTLDEFNVTELTTGGLVNAGQLLVSWIYDTVYLGAVIPYNTVTITILDQSSNVMGSTTVPTGTLGLQNTTVNIVDKMGLGITDATLYTMKCTWANTSTISSKTFYLPVFVA